MRFTSASLLMTALLTPYCHADEAGKAPPTNFVIMIADDVSWNDLGSYGHTRVRTPNLDRLAKDGLRFDAAFLTASSCSPSRCSILTGRYPHNTGAAELHQPLPADQVTIAKLLKAAGYHTAAAGKWHLGKPAEKHFDRVLHGGGPSGCEHWLKVLKERPKDKPFFFWLAAIDAHRPYQEKAIAKPHSLDDVILPPYLPDRPEVRRDFALYYDEITRLDIHVGEVLAELDRQGLAKHTFVLFLADNGRPFPRAKTTLYDCGVRTPFLVRYPRLVKPGGICKSLLSAVDLAPTLAALAKLPGQKSFQGRSFAPLLTNPEVSVRDWVIAEHNWHDYQAHERAVRTKQHLYIRNAFPQLSGSPPADAVRSPTFQSMLSLEKAGKLPPRQRDCFLTPRPAEEFYDVMADPYCLNNLASERKNTAEFKEMSRTLDAWIRETNDRVPEKPTSDKYHRESGLMR